MFVEEITHKLHSQGLVLPRKIIGCEDHEIEQIASTIGRDLPLSYELFMKQCGKCAGRLMSDYDIWYPDTIEQPAFGREIIEDDSGAALTVLGCYYPFGTRQGETVFCFEGAGAEPRIAAWDGESFYHLSPSFDDFVSGEFALTVQWTEQIKGTSADLYARRWGERWE